MSAFNDMCNRVRDRNWGGTSVNVAAEPYISGYSFIKFLHIPYGLSNVIQEDQLGTASDHWKNARHVTYPAKDLKDIAEHMEHAMNSVTPPGGTINKVEFAGLGGSKWAVPGSMDYQNSISIKYYEFSGLPIARIHRAWCNLIRDNRMGLTALNDNNGGQYQNIAYNKQNYGATMAYWTTKPDGTTVEFAAIYTGMFPTKDPMDLFSGDIQSIDKLEIEIEYNVDMIYNDNDVYQACQEWANQGMAGHNVPGINEWGGVTNNWTRPERGFYEENDANQD